MVRTIETGRKRLVMGALCAVGAALGFSENLRAQSISVDPRNGPPGSAATVTGSGFSAGEGAIFWDDPRVSETVAIPASGSFEISFTVPPTASTGSHTITVCNDPACSGRRASTSFEVGPGLAVNPSSGPAGIRVSLTGIGYAAGPATIFWDSIALRTFSIRSGRFTISLVLPAGARVGFHTITVCAGSPCMGGEFALTASTDFEVTRAGPAGTFDVQIQAIEVTQGIRGNIPRRAPPAGASRLTTDDAVHVANRRTIVRVYPWVDAEPGTRVPHLTARLYGIRDGEVLPRSPLEPLNRRLDVIPGETLEARRSDADKSWNFELPAGWVRLGEGEESFRLTFVADANPESLEPECSGCSDNNSVSLPDVEFRHVRRAPYLPLASSTRPVTSPLFIVPYFVTHRCADDAGVPQVQSATMVQFLTSLNELRRLLPIADGSAGMVVMPPIAESWNSGPCRLCDASTPPGVPCRSQSDDFASFDGTMNPRHFPDASKYGDPRGVYRIFFFEWGNFVRGGYSFCRSSYVVGSASTFTILHEVTHAIGLDHAGDGTCAPLKCGDCVCDYPHPVGLVEPNAYGFDTFSLVALPPWRAPFPPPGFTGDPCQEPPGGTTVRSYMSGAFGTKWTSLYTWKNIATLLGSAEVSAGGVGAQANGEYLLLSGSVGVNGVSLAPLFLGAAPHDGPMSNGNYRVEFRDAQGLPLGIEELVVREPLDSPRGTLRFSQPVLAPFGWTTLAVVTGPNDFLELARSPSTPNVFLTEPADGTQWPAAGEATIAWQASDGDNDPLFFRVEASLDGQRWIALATQPTQTSATIDIASVPAGGGNWLVRVQASDGLNVGVSDPRVVSVALKRPQPYILEPAAGDSFAADTTVHAVGVAGDWQDGPVDAENLEWLLDGAHAGTGEQLELSNLTPGEHRLTLEAGNSAGLSGAAEVRFKIVPCADCEAQRFMLGDANDDGGGDLSDVVTILDYLFLGGSLGCRDAANTNEDQNLDITDAVFFLGCLFLGSECPAMGCRLEPTPAQLGCESFAHCE